MLVLTVFFLVWGSFLNVVDYRLIKGQSIVWPRSYCPYCKQTIVWYDNIPVLSWLRLGGKCRSCKAPISILYPFIELLSASALTLLYLAVPLHYFFAYFVFFSALIVNIRTDLQFMLLSRAATLFLIPFTFVFCHAGLLPISLKESLMGAAVGYLVLYALAQTFYLITKKHGMGQGDLDLLAYIGANIGINGVFVTLLMASWSGLIISLAYILLTRKKFTVKIPFGPFLALGAMLYVIWNDAIQMALQLFAF